MNVAFVLLTHSSDEPAGVERAVASLADGLREIGHRALIIAAGKPGAEDEPGLVRLDSVRLPDLLLFDDLPQLFAEPESVCDEVRAVLAAHDIDVVCWADAVVGLGFLSPAPPGVRTALMVHFLRVDDHMRRSLDRLPDAVLAVSPFMIDEAARAGLDSKGWHALPNALLSTGRTPDRAERERLRRTGPVRIVARADPSKGVAELLDAFPEGFGRPLQIVLAQAGFELWPGMQEDMIEGAARAPPSCPASRCSPPSPGWTFSPSCRGRR